MLCLIKIENFVFLEELNRESYNQRPVHRRLKYQLDTLASEVFLLPDLLSESFSCEIKVNCHFHYLYDLNIIFLAEVVWLEASMQF